MALIPTVFSSVRLDAGCAAMEQMPVLGLQEMI